MKKLLIMALMLLAVVPAALAQRMTDRLDRGLVAVKTQGGVYCSWRILGEEYYDVKYNLYRDGTKLNSEPLEVSNFTDAAGTAASTYTVAPVVRGREQAQSSAATVWANNYLEIKMDHSGLTSTYVPNDACCADVDGDGQLEILLKFDNQSWAADGYPKGGHNGEYSLFEVYKLDGTRLWWVNLGPNMADFQNNEQNIVAYDWDEDGRAEAVMRAADGTTIHLADGTEYVIGDKSKNYMVTVGDGQWFVHEGAEYLVYMDGQTGKPYVVTDYPLKRLEDGETDLAKAWGDGYGHRSSKHFFGAPYLDGRHPGIFLARGIYTRHKMIAYDVNPTTHELIERWRWSCNDSSSPYYGQGFHNYAIADVDWDGRDEICFGGMVIDDNGKGLSTTGLGHGDAQHHGDFDPYTWGQEIYTCQEEKPNNCYRDGTTSKIRYRSVGGNDDGRSMAGNFCNDYPGAMGLSARDEAISCVTNGHIAGLSKDNVAQNFRIYWDGDLCEESFNYANGKNTNGAIYKYGVGQIATLTGSLTNNDTKGTPCYQGDLFGDWREEVIMRTAQNNIRIYTTTDQTPWRNYTLWHDHQYRNAMVWQMCGYNQPPHVSYFLGELEGITQAPPALTLTDRTEVADGGTISHSGQQVITCETQDMTVTVADGATPYIYIDNTPSWVQGTGSTSTTNPVIRYEYYTHTLTGGAFAGDMRLVKQGDGTLVLPNVVETYSGPTDVWAGTLRFDGTLQNSRLWLNRHTTLISDGGQFPQGIQADYNATLQPGGDGTVGSITAGKLSLGFGSRIVFDISDSGAADQVNATTLTIEKKVWPNGGGPAYDAPIFRIQGNPVAGKYQLGTIGSIEGNVDDIVIEGLSGKKAVLGYEGGVLTITIQDYVAQTLVWDGGADGKWDVDATANFLTAGGEVSVFVPGSSVTFDDQAKSSTITVVGHVAPSSIAFTNETKALTLTGDSIAGNPELTKSGAGDVTIDSKNHLGNTTISGGKLTVGSLANNSGVDYGSLGSVQSSITIQNGATLAVSETATSDQPIRIGEGGAVVSVASGKTLTQSGLLTGSTQTLTKTGAGTLATPASLNVQRLVIRQGTVTAGENNSVTSLPATVEFQGGTLRDPVNIYSYTTNNANFVVPEGQTGAFYGDSRCNYKGRLTGSGTFNVYATSVRGYFQGNWSDFEGTLVAGTFSSDNYDDNFFFDNTYGLPKATLSIRSGVTFNNNGKSMAIGNVTGQGTLGGSGTYTIGAGGDDINATFSSDAPIVKQGDGRMTCSVTGAIRGSLTVEGGELRFNGNDSEPFFKSSVILRGTASLTGSGVVSSLTMESGTEATLKSQNMIFFTDAPGTLRSTAAVNLKEGSVLNILVAGSEDYSRLLPTFLTMNGTVRVTLMDGYVPKLGDSYTIWETTRTFSGTPHVDLPALPEGLYWDTSALAAKTGVLSVTDDPSAGIGRLSADAIVSCEVFTVGGMRVGSFVARRGDISRQVNALGVLPGAYIVKMQGGRNFESETVVVR